MLGKGAKSLGLVCLNILIPLLAGIGAAQDQQPPRSSSTSANISIPLFASLERLARLVDVSYCLGTTGIRKPFDCVSRCKEFPNLALVNTWSTGFLFGDSCGFIAVDHGQKQDSHSGRHPILIDRNGAIIVAFRGTYSITNTIVDLSTVPQKYVPYPSPDHGGEEPPEKPEHECTNCTVHMGFLQSWQNSREAVLSELKQVKKKYPTYPIHLVGHSLGGAVACLAALELKVSLGWDNLVVTTFGEPRVGNHEMADFIDHVFELDGEDALEQRMYRRVTHTNDPVPLLPPGEWGYKSHGGEIFISKPDLSPSEDDVRLCVGNEDPSCSAGEDNILLSAMHRVLHFFPAGSSVGHFMETRSLPTRLKLWQILFAHRDYFWRLGLCIPGGDPSNWGRDPYDSLNPDEL